MSEKKSILAELIERRDEVFLKMRDREPELYAEMIELNAAISGIKAESSRFVRQDEYSAFRKPSEAIFAYLDRVQKPQPQDEMCQDMVNGGYGRGTERPYADLYNGINYQVTKDKPSLKQINGLIGKLEWPEEWFVTQKDWRK